MSLVSAANALEMEEIPEHHNVFMVLDASGDTKHTWDRRDAGEVATMREFFEAQIKAGKQAFMVRRNGGQGERMREFDAEAEAVIFSPALVGG